MTFELFKNVSRKSFTRYFFEKIGGQLLFLSEFWTHCLIVDGGEWCFLKFLQETDDLSDSYCNLLLIFQPDWPVPKSLNERLVEVRIVLRTIVRRYDRRKLDGLWLKLITFSLYTNILSYASMPETWWDRNFDIPQILSIDVLKDQRTKLLSCAK